MWSSGHRGLGRPERPGRVGIPTLTRTVGLPTWSLSDLNAEAVGRVDGGAGASRCSLSAHGLRCIVLGGDGGEAL